MKMDFRLRQGSARPLPPLDPRLMACGLSEARVMFQRKILALLQQKAADSCYTVLQCFKLSIVIRCNLFFELVINPIELELESAYTYWSTLPYEIAAINLPYLKNCYKNKNPIKACGLITVENGMHYVNLRSINLSEVILPAFCLCLQIWTSQVSKCFRFGM